MKTALFVARFQPLHIGHLLAMKRLLRRYKLVIIIGVKKKDKRNPFTLTERKKMVNSSLRKYRRKYKIIGLSDVNNDKKWANSIKKRVKFDFVVTGNPWVKRCFKNEEVRKPIFFEKKKYNGTRIRKLIKKGKGWEPLVPKECIKIIKKHQ